MRRERALKVVSVLVGLLFSALVYPLTMFMGQEPELAMMLMVGVHHLYSVLTLSCCFCFCCQRFRIASSRRYSSS